VIGLVLAALFLGSIIAALLVILVVIVSVVVAIKAIIRHVARIREKRHRYVARDCSKLPSPFPLQTSSQAAQ